MRGTCELCHEQTEDIVEHLRVLHPDEYGEGFEAWPDGSAVIYDATLSPEDFA